MPESPDPAAARREFEQEAAAALVGRRLVEVGYWDVHNFTDQPRTWDYGDWHHAVMGVDFLTDSGPVCVLWTNTFFPYGVEVFASPISNHLVQDTDGPEGWSVTQHPSWQSRRDPVEAVSVFWDHINVGPARALDGRVVEDAKECDVPVALRLDFRLGPVWLLAAMPQWPDMDDVFVGGDELMVVFSTERMRKIGFPDIAFTRTGRE